MSCPVERTGSALSDEERPVQTENDALNVIGSNVPNGRCVPARGRVLAALRLLLGVSAKDLAAAGELSAFSLSRLERARRSPLPGEFARLLSRLGELVERSVPNRVGRSHPGGSL